MPSKKPIKLIIILILGISLLPLVNSGYAQTSTKFSTKGAVSESSNFHGVIMWTIVNGDKGTIILQSPVGRGMVHVSIAPSTNCDLSMPICLFSTVTDATDSTVFKVGDTARLSINLDSKQESISLLTGVLAGFDTSVNLSQSWTHHNPTSVIVPTNSTKSKHFEIDLNESVGINAKG